MEASSYTIRNLQKGADREKSAISRLPLVKSAAAEYAKTGVLINALSPNMVETKFLEAMDQRVVEMAAQQSAIGRHLTVREVVAAIEFLLSDENSMCGENMVI